METAAATIRFTGAASNSDQSETESEEETWADCQETQKTPNNSPSNQPQSDKKSLDASNGNAPKHKDVPTNSTANTIKHDKNKENELKSEKSPKTKPRVLASGSITPGSPMYDEKMAEMKKNRFNPFDREPSVEQDRTNNSTKSSSLGKSPEYTPSSNSRSGKCSACSVHSYML